MRADQIGKVDLAIKWIDIVPVLVDFVIADGRDDVADLHPGFHCRHVRLDAGHVNPGRFACLPRIFPQLRVACWKK